MQMKGAFIALCLLACSSTVSADENPLGKVLELLDGLAAKVTADGEAEAKAFKEYFAWCDDVTQNTKFEIETATTLRESLKRKSWS